MGKTILVLGGGTGGVVATNVLGKVLPKEHNVVLVDRRDTHLFLASLPLLIVGLRRPDQITRSLSQLERANIQFVQGEIEQLNPGEKTIETNRGTLSYDALIIALGAEHHSRAIPGQAEFSFNPYDLSQALQLQQKLQDFKEGHIVLFISGLPFTGAIAPYEIVLLLDAYFRKRNLSKQIKITLVTPETSPLAIASPMVSRKLTGIMAERGIQIVTLGQVERLQSQGVLVLKNREIRGDLFLGIPIHQSSTPFRNSRLASMEGWLKVDPHTLATCYEDVYALGDAVGIKSPATEEWIPKVGFYAHYQAEVVARNLALKITQQKPRFRFVGDASGASMLTDFSRGCLISVNSYADPPRLSLSAPNRLAYWSKVIFEKYWLTRWF